MATWAPSCGSRTAASSRLDCSITSAALAAADHAIAANAINGVTTERGSRRNEAPRTRDAVAPAGPAQVRPSQGVRLLTTRHLSLGLGVMRVLRSCQLGFWR